MSLRDFGTYIIDTINVIVINTEGRLVALYDGKEAIPDEFLDRPVDRIIRVTFNTIWVQIK